MSPVIILVRPQLGENIGAVARAMSNFGVRELRLVAPRDGWPNKRALEMSSGGAPIIEAATIYPDLPAALADIQMAYATTARPRELVKPVVTPDVAMKNIGKEKMKTALVFGPERTGLENEEINWCDTLITIPTAENSSLNIAQSAVVVLYEWWKVNGSAPAPKEGDIPAPKSDWQGLFDQLEGYLDEVGYFRVTQKKTVMWQNLRNMLMRGQWNYQEVRSFRGMLRNLWEHKTDKE